MLEDIKKIFNQAHREWLECQQNYDLFPEIAARALKLPVNFSHQSVLKMIDDIQPFGWQSFPNNEFGEIPITIFSKDDLLIDIYIWNHTNTAIHDHHFCGAFKVLHGISQQYKYEFEPSFEINPSITRGNLKTIEIKKIETGHIEKIFQYENFIHNVLHLNYPTVTLCLRTISLGKNLHYYYEDLKILFPRRNDKQKCIKAIIQYAYFQDNPNKKEFTYNLLDSLTPEDLFNTLFDGLRTSNEEMDQDILDYINSKSEDHWVFLIYKSLQKNIKLYQKINFLKNFA